MGLCLITTMQNGIFAVRLKLIFFINEKNNERNLYQLV